MFKGSLVALITPFQDGAVDETAFQEHVAWQIGQGTHGLVPIGTTGECPALEEEEQERLIKLCVEVAKGRAPVIPGTGFNSTAHTIAATRVAKEAGADAALIVCPYYNKPTQEGLYQHFRAVHDAVDLPIIIYNIPGRSAVDMTNATMARLAQLPNIVGVKDATNDLARPLRMRVEIGPEFCLLSGEDATAVASSPDSRQKPSPISTRILSGRARSLVASLTPMTFGSLASRAIVAFDMSTELRPGML